MPFVRGFIVAWIGKCIDSRHHEPCKFSKEYYVGDGRAKGVDARANARVCPGLATPLVDACNESKHHFDLYFW